MLEVALHLGLHTDGMKDPSIKDINEVCRQEFFRVFLPDVLCHFLDINKCENEKGHHLFLIGDRYKSEGMEFNKKYRLSQYSFLVWCSEKHEKKKCAFANEVCSFRTDRLYEIFCWDNLGEHFPIRCILNIRPNSDNMVSRINNVVGSAIGLAMHSEFCNAQGIDNHRWCQLFWFSYLIWSIIERSEIDSTFIETGKPFWDKLWEQLKPHFDKFLDALVTYTSKWEKQLWPSALQNKVTPEAGLWALYRLIETCKNRIRSDRNGKEKWREEITELTNQLRLIADFINTCSRFFNKIQLAKDSHPLYFDNVWLGEAFYHFSHTDCHYRTWELPLQEWAYDFFIWAVLAIFDRKLHNYKNLEVLVKTYVEKELYRREDISKIVNKLIKLVADKKYGNVRRDLIKEVVSNWKDLK
jgi:hypothetical protein